MHRASVLGGRRCGVEVGWNGGVHADEPVRRKASFRRGAE